MSSEPILRLERITKRFAGVTALDAVDFTLGTAEIQALVGENGAGKSTLVKIMTGVYRRDAGTMTLAGRTVEFDTPAHAQAAGVIAVHQEIHLLEYRSVAENIFLGREPLRFGFIDWRRMYADATSLIEKLALDIDPRTTLGALDTARQQMVAIARGVSLGARVLILDEPTSSLSEREVSILFDLMRRLKEQGTAIVYISHRLDELYAICDRVTVLRDGRIVGSYDLPNLERVELVRLMLGRSREAVERGATGFAARRSISPAAAHEPPLLAAERLRREPKLRGVSLELRRGEIVGLAGLLGSGRTETARVLFGADAPNDGTMRLAGKPLHPRNPAQAIAAGIAFLPEDRKAEGIIPELSIRENLTLAILPRLTRFGVVSRAKQRAIVDRFMQRLGIKAASAEQRIRELSGGNQQKVLLARWLCMQPALLILDEPTRGIDVGAKMEIQSLIDELAAGDLGVLMISSELEELVEGSTRVVVLRDGRSVAELAGDTISEHAIMHAMAEGNDVLRGETPPS